MYNSSATLALPFRFGAVEENVFRGAYPKARNKRFLKRFIILSYICHHLLPCDNRLHLKTILSLIPEPPKPELHDFCAQEKVNNIWICVKKPKDNLPLTYTKVVQALEVNLGAVYTNLGVELFQDRLWLNRQTCHCTSTAWMERMSLALWLCACESCKCGMLRVLWWNSFGKLCQSFIFWCDLKVYSVKVRPRWRGEYRRVWVLRKV
jgi:hypothetical protein